MTPLASEYVSALEIAFEANRNPEAAVPMKAYMRDQFDYIGMPAPRRGAVVRDAIAGLGLPDQADLESLARSLWAMRERDYQYAACSIVRQGIKRVDASFLATARLLITTKPWWDTVDELAHHVVGPLVLADRALASVMDEWIGSDDIWLARTAIIHQARFTSETDTDRLFSYCLERAGDPEFFIRKAIGWALRDYSKIDGAAVRRFVDEHDRELSALSKRDALKWLDRRAAREGA
ncbi:MAG: DNA alkylation repair protein [Actinobacteria bacterium]|nr:DNA alkylation repair protein [Actinomycetota bacterium]